MNPKHVSSLESSIKLKSLGVKQESEFFWCGTNKIDKLISKHERNIFYRDNKDDIYSAFLSSELIDMLPNFFDYNGVRYYDLSIERVGDLVWILQYRGISREGYSSECIQVESFNLVDAFTKMLIHLLENKIISVEEVNKRIGESKR